MLSKLKLHIRDLKILVIDTYYALLARYSWRSGISEDFTDQGHELIVSLTTIPSRIDTVHLVIEGLLRQSLRPRRIALWVNGADEEGSGCSAVSASLRKQMARGLEVYFTKETWPHKKLIHSLEKWPNALIVTTDDDIVQPPNWLQELYEAYLEEPAVIHCHRARLVKRSADGEVAPYLDWPFESPELCFASHKVVPTGVGGVLYFPGALHPDVFDASVAKQLCPYADDLWFKIMALRQGTQSKATKSFWVCPHVVRGSQKTSLMQVNLGRNENDKQWKALTDYYHLSIDKIMGGHGTPSD